MRCSNINMVSQTSILKPQSAWDNNAWRLYQYNLAAGDNLATSLVGGCALAFKWPQWLPPPPRHIFVLPLSHSFLLSCICLSASLSICLFTILCVYLYVFITICMHINLYTHPSIHPSSYLSVCKSISVISISSVWLCSPINTPQSVCPHPLFPHTHSHPHTQSHTPVLRDCRTYITLILMA